MTARTPRLLVAGIGNVFLADDAFGPEVIRALAARPLPPSVDVTDFGIRGMDLAYRLLDGYDVAILVDAAPRGGPPGSLYVVEPDLDACATAAPEAHAMDPVKVLALARHLADTPLPRVVVLGCEPLVRLGAGDDISVGLSAPVRDAVEPAVDLLHQLVPTLLADPRAAPTPGPLGRAEEKEAPLPPRGPHPAQEAAHDR
ncbi:peptidase M52 [Streptomyces mashuensis]|uniref:Peptidase M52 n=1 Tax=Streptomyces mashuensis TaxID=33904 RepID=A0A919B8H8_9ACTN|nr:hydrogenase maturation protease [Streptomyces mashuensis]GHF71736.1 peptidase M52 [Streptomyces mashuensis]